MNLQQTLLLLGATFLSLVLPAGSRSTAVRTLTIPHNALPGHVVTLLPLVDERSYRLHDDTGAGLEQLFSLLTTGELMLNQDVSRYNGVSITLVVEQTAPSSHPGHVVNMEVKQAPVGTHFEGGPFVGHIKENLPPGSEVTTLDALTTSFRKFPVGTTLSLVSGDAEAFALRVEDIKDASDADTDDMRTVYITSRRSFDRETTPHIRLGVRAQHPSLAADQYAVLSVLVDDVNDNKPVFERAMYSTKVRPDTKPLDVLLRVHATDADGEPIEYSVDKADKDAGFDIDSQTGDLLIIEPANLKGKDFEIPVFARDFRGKDKVKAIVRIYGSDDEDETGNAIQDMLLQLSQHPERRGRLRRAIRDPLVFVVDRKQTGDLFLVRPEAAAPEERYSIKEPFPANLRVHAETGVVSAAFGWTAEDAEVQIVINVTRTDDGTFQDDHPVRIVLVDRNVSSHLFTNTPRPLRTYVPTWIRPDTVIYRLEAEDARVHGAHVRYQLQTGGDGRFTVHPETGEVRTLQRQPFEFCTRYDLAVSAQVVGAVPSTTTPTQVLEVHCGFIPPQFYQPEYRIKMDEYSTKGTAPVAMVEAKSFYDLPLEYSIASVNTSAPLWFTVAASTGALHPTERAMSYLTSPRQYRMVVTAREPASGFRTSVNVTVDLNDINDMAPFFAPDVYVRRDLPENAPVGTAVLQVTALDRDVGVNSQLSFNISNDLFRVEQIGNENRATIVVNKKLDYDLLENRFYQFTVTASDAGTPPLSGTAQVRVWITDVNDHAPVAVPKQQKVYVKERAPQGTLVHVVQFYDPDKGDTFTYSFPNGELIYEQTFQLDPSTGYITLYTDLTSAMELKNLTVEARDSDGRVGIGYVIIDFIGVNRPPSFPDCSRINARLFEGRPANTGVINITGFDPDSGSNGQMTFTMLDPPNREKLFGIRTVSRNMAEVFALQELDRENPVSEADFYIVGNQLKYSVIVKVSDNGRPQLSTTCFFLITMEDMNDQPPRFDSSSYVLNIPEQPAVSSKLVQVFATDLDEASNGVVTYTISQQPTDCSNCFTIHPQTGWISLIQPLSGLNSQSLNLNVTATDGGSPPLSSHVRVKLILSDQLPPRWEPVEGRPIHQLNISILETLASGTEIDPVLTVTPQLTDAGAVLFFIVKGRYNSLNKDNHFVSYEVKNQPNSMKVKVAAQLDYEKTPSYILQLRASYLDQNTLRADTYLRVNLIDANDHIPAFIGQDEFGAFPAAVSEESPSGAIVASVFAVDKDGTAPYNTVRYYFDSECGEDCQMFLIDESTGEIRSTRKFQRTDKSRYNLYVIAMDGRVGDPMCDPPTMMTNCRNRSPGRAPVRVDVLSSSMAPPYFDTPKTSVTLREGFKVNQVVTKVEAINPEPDLTYVQYGIIGGNTHHTFAVEFDTGVIFQVGEVDFADSPYLLQYRVFDGQVQDTTTINITVLPRNVYPPRFTVVGQEPMYTVNTVTEQDKSISFVQQIEAVDPRGRVSDIEYDLAGYFYNEDRSRFSLLVEDNKATVYLNKVLDRDYPGGYSNWQINVVARYATATLQEVKAYAILNIRPQDVDDSAPVFDVCCLEGEVREDTAPGTSVLQVRAVDYDQDTLVSYSLVGGDVDMFTIDTQGNIKTLRQPDRETQDMHTLVVRATDMADHAVDQTVWITVLDANDNGPKFLERSYSVLIPEGEPVGASVLTVSAQDPDVGENARRTYTVVRSSQDSANFYMDSIFSVGAGVIKIAQPLDFELLGTRKYLTFNVEVQGPKPTDRDQVLVNVTVYDVNDNAPVVMPPIQTIEVPESAPVGQYVTELNATDADMGQNQVFSWALDYANSDPKKRFGMNAETGAISIRHRLDRESVGVHNLTVLCVDKGEPALTGTAYVVVMVADLNEHAPRFAQHDIPIVRKSTAVNERVAGITIEDLDSAENGPPFSVEIDCNDEANIDFCTDFNFEYVGDADQGQLRVSTKLAAYQEARVYTATVVMTDSGQPPLSAARTLVVQVEDTNNHPHSPGTKHVRVYNYKGLFDDVSLGRVYAADKDKEDNDDKRYTLFDDPDGFILENNGELKLGLGVGPGQYRLRVLVEDQLATVESTVIVDVIYIHDNVIANSGSIRLSGLSPEELIERPSNKPPTVQVLQETLADILDTKPEHVDIFTVLPVPDEPNMVDVRYSAHGSPLYRPARMDGLAWTNKQKIADRLSAPNKPVTVAMAPVDLCEEETCFDSGCTNKLMVLPNAASVHTSTASLVGVNAYVEAKCQCAAELVDAVVLPERCSDTSCYNNGTCVQTQGSVRCECPVGFQGPRCQQTKVEFTGSGWAWYKTPSQCENGVLSFQFATTQADGVLLYLGPMHDTSDTDIRDFLLVELQNGYPILRADLGSGEARAVLNGQNKDRKRVMEELNDGEWHTIEIVKMAKRLRLIVDYCRVAEIVENINATYEDRSSCEADLTTPGYNFLLNVNTPLQLGGRSSTPNYPRSVLTQGFKGCMKELRYNGELYDLHIGEVGESKNTRDGCGAEGGPGGMDVNVVTDNGVSSSYNPNKTCVGNLVNNDYFCTCKPGLTGDDCKDHTTTRDLRSDQSFLQWALKDSYNTTLSNRHNSLQMMFRTRHHNARLFYAASFSTLERVIVQLVDSHVEFVYDLGSGDKVVSLPHVNVSDGEWHAVFVHRYGNQAILQVDGGEGRFYAESVPDNDFRLISLSGKRLFGGADVTYRPFHTEPDVNNVLVDSCVTDVRYNEDSFPMARGEKSVAADLTEERNVDMGCADPTLCAPNVLTCSSPQICIHVWRQSYCGCPVNQTVVAPPALCLPVLDCSIKQCTNGICVPVPGPEGFICQCFDGWTGKYCETEEGAPIVGTSATASSGLIAAVVVSIIVLLLLILLAICFVRSRQKRAPLLVVEPEDDVRDNVVFYDEEGAGEEDQQAYDITRLQKPIDPDADSTHKGPYDDEPPYRNDVLPLTSAEPMPEPRYPHFLSPDGPGGKFPNIGNFIDHRLDDADLDPNAPPYDSVREYQYEGGGSLAGSLSSLQSSSSGDQDYDYLNNWGPRFQKLADLYGGGDGDDEEDEEEDEEDASNV